MVAAEFGRFLGLPITRGMNITDIIEAVVGVCTDTRTGLVLVDEVHNISLATRNGAEVADTLKYFSERIPATFVYAGIDIERSNLLSGTRGASRSPDASPSSPPTPFPTTPSGKAWSQCWRARCCCTAHTPASLPPSTDTSTTEPVE